MFFTYRMYIYVIFFADIAALSLCMSSSLARCIAERATRSFFCVHHLHHKAEKLSLCLITCTMRSRNSPCVWYSGSILSFTSASRHSFFLSWHYDSERDKHIENATAES